MPCPCFQAKIYAKGNNAKTSSWTLPLWFGTLKSPSLMMGFGDHPILLNARIAKELDIKDGDNMWFEVEEFEGRKTFCYPVHVCNAGFTFDFCINGALNLEPKMIHSYAFDSATGSILRFLNGKSIKLIDQHMFSSIKVIRKRGLCVLHFDGGCRNNPKGPAGYGFRITSMNDGAELVKGYGFKLGENTSNTMEYRGLIEGVTWAKRLDPEVLSIKGDSEVVINQVIGMYNVNNPVLKKCYEEVMAIIRSIAQIGTQVQYDSISRMENRDADALANLGMDRCENKVEVNWMNVNKFMGNGI